MEKNQDGMSIGKLPDLAVNGKKILMLSPVESLDESHRHHSHAMATYTLFACLTITKNKENYSNEGSFSNSGNYDNGGSDGNGGNGNKDITDKEIIDATVSNLELLGTGLWVGYSFPWMAEFYAKQEMEGAAYQLKLFWECFAPKMDFT